MLLNLLHTNALCLGLLAFLVPQGMHLMVLCKTFDELGSEFAGVGLLSMVLAGRSHASNRASLETGGRGKKTCTASLLCSSSTLGVHHQPLVLLFSIVLLEVLGSLPIDIVLSNSAEVSAAISLNDDKVSRLDGETSALLNVEDISSRTLKQHNVKKLVVARLGNAIDIAMRGGCTIPVKVGQPIRRCVLIGKPGLVRISDVGTSAKVLACCCVR
ncbi:hypothetical protein HG530_004541 [Fusarium avenaceum]|nr:hypothetical protein HG530_004541 [Fusarium avenaceum]